MNEHVTQPADIRRLVRSREDRYVAGVCGGLAEYFDLHPTFFRVGFIVLTLLGGSGILIYLAAILIIPDAGHDDSIAADALRRHRDKPAALAVMAAVAAAFAIVVSRASWNGGADLAWTVLVIGGAWLFLAQRGRRAALVVVTSLATLATVAVVLTVVAFAYLDVHPSNGIGTRSYAPTNTATLQRVYKLGIGSMKLDLGSLRLPAGQTRVDAAVGIGSLQVVAPPNTRLIVDGVTRYGDIEVLGRRHDGRNATVTLNTAHGEPTRTLVLKLRVSAGDLDVRRALP